MKEASELIRKGLVALLAVLKRRAIEFKHTPTIGRTHGIHAEPTTFGLKLLNWYAEMERNLARFDAAAEDMRVGKLSGAVGTFGHLKPEHEERICARLGLKPAPVATQVIQRDRHAAYIGTLAIIGSTLDKIAVEIRHLQRTEVREAQEYFSEKQKGSSAMPHKKNPITSEQISGLARVLRGNAQAAFENVALWHERDISHSSVERVIFPDSTILVDYLLAKTTDLIDRLLVYPERMKKNLESTGGLIFCGQLLLDLAEAGMLREDAYRLVQSHAMRAWKDDLCSATKWRRIRRLRRLLSRGEARQDLRLHAAAGQCGRDLQAGAGRVGVSQIPDHAAERVLNTIEEVVNSADEELEDAEQWMKALVEEFPEASIVHSYYAWVLSREGKHREAIEHGRVAVKLSPESEISSIMLFRVLWSAGERQQAFDEMKRLEKHGVSDGYALLMQEWNEGKPADGARNSDRSSGPKSDQGKGSRTWKP